MTRVAHNIPGLQPLTQTEIEAIKNLPLRKSSQRVSNCVIAFFQRIGEFFGQWNQSSSDVKKLGSGERSINAVQLLQFHRELKESNPSDKTLVEARLQKLANHLGNLDHQPTEDDIAVLHDIQNQGIMPQKPARKQQG
jgi:hypothetical protein